MRLLVTGATGFVGRAVMRALAPHEDIVTRCVVRTGATVPEASEIVETDDLFAEPANWWAKHCTDVDTVLHIAWYTEPGKYLTSDKNLDCLSGTLALAKGAQQAGVRRFVGTGTCFEYALSDDGIMYPDSPLAPQTPYAAAKVSAYQTLKAWFEIRQVSFLWARLFYIHGEGEDPRRLVPQIRSRLAAGEVADLIEGTQIRDFIEINEAARLLVAQTLGTETDATNISTGAGITVRAFAEGIADEFGRRDLLNFGGHPGNLTDPPIMIGPLSARRPQE